MHSTGLYSKVYFELYNILTGCEILYLQAYNIYKIHIVAFIRVWESYHFSTCLLLVHIFIQDISIPAPAMGLNSKWLVDT